MITGKKVLVVEKEALSLLSSVAMRDVAHLLRPGLSILFNYFLSLFLLPSSLLLLLLVSPFPDHSPLKQGISNNLKI
jgi:hypothetical protein